MAVKQLTTSPTEADYEGSMVATIAKVFPWLPAGDVRHQIKFAFNFGRASIEVDGAAEYRKEGRADIVLYNRESPLAVLELKRHGLPLSSDDEAQGLSYARVLNPMAPLVVVTNGDEVRLVKTHDGLPLDGAPLSETQFTAVVTAAARVAKADVARAIETLMGTNPTVWRQAVQQVSAAAIQELTATASDHSLPFDPNFLLERKCTVKVRDHLAQGDRLILVEGQPLIGKSNVLRELVEKTRDDENLVTLFVSADGSGVIQSLADAFASQLAWPVTTSEARHWLIQLSNSENVPALVIAVDGFDPSMSRLRREIADLTSPSFGGNVRVVVGIDDSATDLLTGGDNGRSSSPMGRRAKRVVLKRLDDEEYGAALQELGRHRILMMRGADSARELRFPWVLRSMVSDIFASSRHKNPESRAALAPLLSLGLIAHARSKLRDPELRYLFKELAAAFLKEAQDRKRSFPLMLESLGVFLIRRKNLGKRLDDAQIKQLIARGYLKAAIHDSGEAVVAVRLPELLASELAGEMAVELARRSRTNPLDAADWLSSAAGNLPMGDVICAQAVFDASMRNDLGLRLDVIVELLKIRPTRDTLNPGTRLAMHSEETGLVDLDVREDGSMVARAGGREAVIDKDDGEDLDTAYSNFHSWLILSHLASLPSVFDIDGEEHRIDPIILHEVGSADIILRQPGPEMQFNGVLAHDVPGVGSIVCHRAGIVEAITYAMFLYIKREGRSAAPWIVEACNRESLPLIHRVSIALQFLSEMGSEDHAAFATEMLDGPIAAAMDKFPKLHPKDS
ncbi:type I restriction enzyme HsdR N-terminal domain-containing protein [Rhizobium ruizarguesonis]|uniref:type I restriction enzyme HsdR N-terminal domain-containing protein n=1 Tax=Rhizobium ruizarguesonis TaxID=2081791 RepID=UPI001031723D|nr:type I restriction enzyme HsdR N-terminal domain-containing protein [Rhizobium ruizarguesonis]TAZ56711.1 hypothetical protein ELH71_09995 [Rhizobium ruizarguesonis]